MHRWTSAPTGEPFELNPHSPQAVGLRGWWPCLDSRGVNCLEERWAGLRGAFGASTAAPTWVNTGDQGWALDFASASSQYVDCGDRAAWDFASESFAVSLWFKTTTTGTNYIVSKYSSAGGSGWLVYMASGATAGRLRFFIASGAAYLERRTSTAYNDGAWHHALCVASWSGSAYSIRIYVDGIQDDTASAASGSPANLAVAQPLRFGSASNGANYYNGQLRDLRVTRGDPGLNEARHLWSPETRWDLYRLLRRPVRIITGAGDALIKSLSETLALTEGRSLGIARALAETLALTDARTLAAAKALAESVGLSDALTHLLTLTLALNESLALTDTRSLAAAKALAEALALTDTRSLGLARLLAETLTLVEARALGAARGLAESLSLSDGRSLGADRALAEALALTDTRSLSAAKALSETLALSDAATAILTLVLDLAETLALSEARALGAGKGLTEAVTLTDSRALAASRNLAELLALAEARSLTGAKQLAELLALSDARGLAFQKSLPVSLELTETRSAGAAKSLAELLSLEEARTLAAAKLLAETLSLAELLTALIGGGAELVLSLTETLSFADQVALRHALARYVAALLRAAAPGATLLLTPTPDGDLRRSATSAAEITHGH